MTSAAITRPRRDVLLALVMSLVLSAVAVGCRGSTSRTPDPVRTIVAGPTGRYREIAVVARAARAVVAGGDASKLAPLLAARTIAAAEPLASYGLDPPAATLEYALAAGASEMAATVVVEVGRSDFDHHFVYVVRPPDRTTIDLVPTGVLAPVLARVGITLPPPS